MATETEPRMITENLNDLVEQGEKDANFRIACCARWRGFRDGEGIADDLADYARQAFPRGLTSAQDAAIRSFPTEPLLLLRHLVVRALGCGGGVPTGDPPPIGPIALRFSAEQTTQGPASIRVDLSGDNKATVTFRAAEIV